jgi:RNA recognition motif-containing protein
MCVVKSTSFFFPPQLDYKVDEKKLKEVFRLAGKVVSAELSLDKEGKSRGFGVIEYEHPVEAVQAICILFCWILSYASRHGVCVHVIYIRAPEMKFIVGKVAYDPSLFEPRAVNCERVQHLFLNVKFIPQEL